MPNLFDKTNSARKKILKLSEQQDKIFEDLLTQILKRKNISVNQEAKLLDYCFNNNSPTKEEIQLLLDD